MAALTPDSAPIRVFVSFSSRDEAYLEAFQEHLSLLKRQALIDVWTHHALRPGETWEPTLLEALQGAELVVLLVSSAFMSSDYIQEKELAITLERHRRGEVWVVPVLIRAVDLTGDWIDGLQTLPPGREPIHRWPAPDDFWVAVTTGIRALVPVLREMRRTRGARVEPIGVPSDQRADRQEWRVLVERILALEQAGMPEEMLTPLRRRAAALKRAAREGRPLSAGEVLDDRFLVLEQIGQGGFARVWKALDLSNNEVVALKVLKDDFAQDATHRERFALGIRALSRLEHPGIVALRQDFRQESGYVTVDGSRRGRYYYCAMEYLAGGDLLRHVKRNRPPPEEVLRITCEVAGALEYAHSRTCIHPDVKPGNILLTAEGHPKLTDFDLAKLGESSHDTRTGSLGTFVYAAPEMHESGTNADGRADVYALAMTAVCGLHGNDRLYNQIMGNRERFLSSLPVPPPVQDVLIRALAWEPADRYPTMKAFREALEAAVAPPPPGPDETARHDSDLAATNPEAAENEPAAENAPEAPPDPSEPVVPDRNSEAPTTRRGRSGTTVALLGISVMGLTVLAWQLWPASEPEQTVPSPVASAVAPSSSPAPAFAPTSTPASVVEPVTTVQQGRQLPPGSRITWVPIPEGDFQMGSEIGGDDEKPVHRVHVLSFQMSKTEVTVKQYQACVDAGTCVKPGEGEYCNGGKAGRDDRPINCVSWDDAQKFVEWLGDDARLPSEAEWEYAAKAGTENLFSGTNDKRLLCQYANVADQAAKKTFPRWSIVDCNDGYAKTAPVGHYRPNAWGLYDTTGNVWEWVQDCYQDSYQDAPSDGTARPTCTTTGGELRVLRGGSWNYPAAHLRAANRGWGRSGDRVDFVGFRVVRPASRGVPP